MSSEFTSGGEHNSSQKKHTTTGTPKDPEKSSEKVQGATGENRGEGEAYRDHPLELKIPPVVVFAFFAAVMSAIAVYFPVFDVDIPFRLFITAFLVMAAGLTGLYSIYLFLRKATTVHAHKPGETVRMITTGPYKHTRNPMYLSLSLVLIALGIFLSDLLALMLMPAFYWYLTRFQIIPEERRLIDKFGEDYQNYADKTPRWL